MIKRFCDKCGKEIIAEANDYYVIKVQLQNGYDASEQYHICRKCMVDVWKGLRGRE